MFLEELFSGEYNVFKRNFWIVAFAENKRPLEVKSAFAFAMKEDVIAFYNGKMYKKKVEELKAGDFLLGKKGNNKMLLKRFITKMKLLILINLKNYYRRTTAVNRRTTKTTTL